jgi:hypothetical protein
LLSESIIESTIQAIRGISLPEGGFACHRGESFRADATAWAVLALEAYPGNRDLTLPACRRLAKSQLSDGRIPEIDGHSESYWPTALAVLAWEKVAGFERQVELALRFLLNATGIHRPKQKNAPIAHDPSIKGWPWIENTYSWIEPTALTMLTLKVCGFAGHNRVLEAKRMILDRQLPSGGWNYGNTRVFRTMLRPNPVCTGYALSALSGLTEPSHVELSLEYLNHEIEHLRTPLSLSWAIFGLAAWPGRIPEVRKLILDSLSLQKRYGTYETTLLAQLIVAYFTTGDLLSLFFN